MTVPFDPSSASSEARLLFERLWSDGDPWSLDASELDQARYRAQLRLIGDQHYSRVLEIGCGSGSFTQHLVPLATRLVAVDISEHAVQAARERLGGTTVDLRIANVMDIDPTVDGPWDLIVVAEVAYYLGWLYPMFSVAWLAHAFHESMIPGGRLLLVDTIGHENGLMSDWLIQTYRDLHLNVGFAVEASEILHGTKEGVEFDIRLDLFQRPK